MKRRSFLQVLAGLAGAVFAPPVSSLPGAASLSGESFSAGALAPPTWGFTSTRAAHADALSAWLAEKWDEAAFNALTDLEKRA